MILMIEEYFTERQELKAVFVLIDSKIGPTEDDKMMISFLNELGRKVIVVLTKADKAKQSEVHKTKMKITKLCDDFIQVSSLKGTNIGKLKKIIDSQL